MAGEENALTLVVGRPPAREKEGALQHVTARLDPEDVHPVTQTRTGKTAQVHVDEVSGSPKSTVEGGCRGRQGGSGEVPSNRQQVSNQTGRVSSRNLLHTCPMADNAVLATKMYVK